MDEKYRNHVLLTGLDEARAHQRGEQVGSRLRARTPLDATMADERAAQNTRYYDLTDDQRIEIAQTKGSVFEIASEWNINKDHVKRLRRRLGEGKLYSSEGVLAVRVSQRRHPDRDRSRMEEIAKEAGTAREVAARLEVPVDWVYICRSAYKQRTKE
jgi:hypothetical protein